METVPIPEAVAQPVTAESTPVEAATPVVEAPVVESPASDPEGGSLHYLPGHEPVVEAEKPALITDIDQIQSVAVTMQPQMNEALRIEGDAAALREIVALKGAETLSVNQLPGVEEKAADALEARAGELRAQAEAKAANVAGPTPEPTPFPTASVTLEGSSQAA